MLRPALAIDGGQGRRKYAERKNDSKGEGTREWNRRRQANHRLKAAEDVARFAVNDGIIYHVKQTGVSMLDSGTSPSS